MLSTVWPHNCRLKKKRAAPRSSSTPRAPTRPQTPGSTRAGGRSAPAPQRRAEGVLEEHRDRERTPSARDRRERPGDIGDGRVNVAHDDRAFPIEGAEPCARFAEPLEPL